jgi:hypothetical protein
MVPERGALQRVFYFGEIISEALDRYVRAMGGLRFSGGVVSSGTACV